jgi:hypothetical protein
MRKTRTIVAVTLLATALCADRRLASAATGAAEPGSRTEAGPVVRGFAQRLTVSLRRVVSTVKLHQGRQEGVAPQVVQAGRIERAQAGVRQGGGTPFQFRLPPPVA